MSDLDDNGNQVTTPDNQVATPDNQVATVESILTVALLPTTPAVVASTASTTTTSTTAAQIASLSPSTVTVHTQTSQELLLLSPAPHQQQHQHHQHQNAHRHCPHHHARPEAPPCGRGDRCVLSACLPLVPLVVPPRAGCRPAPRPVPPARRAAPAPTAHAGAGAGIAPGALHGVGCGYGGVCSGVQPPEEDTEGPEEEPGETGVCLRCSGEQFLEEWEGGVCVHGDQDGAGAGAGLGAGGGAADGCRSCLKATGEAGCDRGDPGDCECDCGCGSPDEEEGVGPGGGDGEPGTGEGLDACREFTDCRGESGTTGVTHDCFAIHPGGRSPAGTGNGNAAGIGTGRCGVCVGGFEAPLIGNGIGVASSGCRAAHGPASQPEVHFQRSADAAGDTAFGQQQQQQPQHQRKYQHPVSSEKTGSGKPTDNAAAYTRWDSRRCSIEFYFPSSASNSQEAETEMEVDSGSVLAFASGNRPRAHSATYRRGCQARRRRHFRPDCAGVQNAWSVLPAWLATGLVLTAALGHLLSFSLPLWARGQARGPGRPLRDGAGGWRGECMSRIGLQADMGDARFAVTYSPPDLPFQVYTPALPVPPLQPEELAPGSVTAAPPVVRTLPEVRDDVQDVDDDAGGGGVSIGISSSPQSLIDDTEQLTNSEQLIASVSTGHVTLETGEGGGYGAPSRDVADPEWPVTQEGNTDSVAQPEEANSSWTPAFATLTRNATDPTPEQLTVQTGHAEPTDLDLASRSVEGRSATADLGKHGVALEGGGTRNRTHIQTHVANLLLGRTSVMQSERSRSFKGSDIKVGEYVTIGMWNICRGDTCWMWCMDRLPGWFRLVQAFTTLGLVFCLMTSSLAVCQIAMPHCKDKYLATGGAAVTLLVGEGFATVAISVFGARLSHDRHLAEVTLHASWSFYIAVLSVVVGILGVVFLLWDTRVARLDKTAYFDIDQDEAEEESLRLS